MRAIRVKKRSKGNHYGAHWLTDDEGTRCGLSVDGLEIVEELELETLPPLEACGSCARTVESVPHQNLGRNLDEPRYYRQALPASYGRSSSSGKLRHTGQSGHGHRLPR